ncbi:MAG: LamG domain-containing protein [Saprospiraceae bacterium]|nr:LamG domain-containing protein [Saprospiraceae bacterium]
MKRIRGNGIKFNGDAGIRFNRDLDFDRDHPFAVSLWVKFLKTGEEGPIFGKTNGDFEGYRGWLCKLNPDGTLSFQLNHVWPDNCIDFQTVESVAIDKWTHLVMSYDGSSRADGVKFYVNGKIPPFKLHTDHLKKSLLHGVGGSNWSNQPFLLGMELRKSIQYMMADELKVFKRNLSELEIQFLYAKNSIGQDHEDAWFAYYLLSGKNPKYNSLLGELQQLRCEENLLMTDQPEVMVMHEKVSTHDFHIKSRCLRRSRGLRGTNDSSCFSARSDLDRIKSVEFG